MRCESGERNPGGKRMSNSNSNSSVSKSQSQSRSLRPQLQQPLPSFPRSYFPPRPLYPPPPPYTRHHPTHYYPPPPPPPPPNPLPLSTPLLKVASSPVSQTNGYNNSRDTSRDEALFVTVRDRKLQVRVSEAASLYALCRSWLRNGLPEENQLQYGDGVKSLPRPLPLPVLDAHSPIKEEAEEEAEEEEKDEGPVDQLSPKDILKRHVKRAKKVRARVSIRMIMLVHFPLSCSLREERLKRIARYKTRLALLLPPHVEQLRNDAFAGN